MHVLYVFCVVRMPAQWNADQDGGVQFAGWMRRDPACFAAEPVVHLYSSASGGLHLQLLSLVRMPAQWNADQDGGVQFARRVQRNACAEPVLQLRASYDTLYVIYIHTGGMPVQRNRACNRLYRHPGRLFRRRNACNHPALHIRTPHSSSCVRGDASSDGRGEVHL